MRFNYLFVVFFLGCQATATPKPGEKNPDAILSSSNSSDKIVLKIEQLRSNKGSVHCALYNKSSAFLSVGKAVQVTTAKIDNRQTTCTFSGLPAGEYAIGAFHDENGNDLLDTSFIGIPKEGMAVSNNAKGSFGPPKYKDAKFNFKGGELPLSINTIYL